MRRIPSLPFGASCAAIPLRNGSSETEGFIDTGTQLLGMDPQVFLSVGAVREMARLIGTPSPDELDGLRERNRQLEARVVTLTAELRGAQAERDDMRQTVDGIEGLTKRGLVLRKAPGRKPTRRERKEVEA